MEITTKIGEFERQLEELGLKPHNIITIVSERLGVNRTTYERWRNGETKPRLDTFLTLDQHFKQLRRDVKHGKHIRPRRVARRRHRKAKGASR